jgi:hypothetical protein
MTIMFAALRTTSFVLSVVCVLAVARADIGITVVPATNERPTVSVAIGAEVSDLQPDGQRYVLSLQGREAALQNAATIEIEAAWVDARTEGVILRSSTARAATNATLRIYRVDAACKDSVIFEAERLPNAYLSNLRGYFIGRWLFARCLASGGQDFALTIRAAKLWFDRSYNLVVMRGSIFARDPDAEKAAKDYDERARTAATPLAKKIRAYFPVGRVGLAMQQVENAPLGNYYLAIHAYRLKNQAAAEALAREMLEARRVILNTRALDRDAVVMGIGPAQTKALGGVIDRTLRVPF